LSGERIIQEPMMMPAPPEETMITRLGFTPIIPGRGVILRTEPGVQTKADIALTPAISSASVLASMQDMGTRALSDVREMVRPALASIQTPSLAQSSASDLAERLGIVQVPALIPAQVQEPIITPIIIPGVTQIPEITQIPELIPVVTTIPVPGTPYTPWTPPPPVPTPPFFPGFGWPPSGGGGDLFRMRQRKAFVEIFPIGLDISTFGGRPKAKKRTYKTSRRKKGKK